MFSALRIDLKQKVLAWEEPAEELRKIGRAGLLCCPACEGRVLFREGLQRSAHFYHWRTHCSYEFYEPETPEHEKGKLLLWQRLRSLYPDARVEIELWLPSIRQRPDVFVSLHDSTQWAFEFQRARISGETWLKRHESYRAAGIYDLWIFDTALLRHQRLPGDTSSRLSLTELENATLITGLPLCYLDTQKEAMCFIGKAGVKPHIESGLLVETETWVPFEHCSLQNGRWWSEELERLTEVLDQIIPETLPPFDSKRAESEARRQKEKIEREEERYHKLLEDFSRPKQCDLCGSMTTEWIIYKQATNTCICRECANKTAQK